MYLFSCAFWSIFPEKRRAYCKKHEKLLVESPATPAMFQHVNGSTDSLRELVVDLTGNALPVVLAKEETTIYFTKTHLSDLKAIIAADECDTDSTAKEPVNESPPPEREAIVAET